MSLWTWETPLHYIRNVWVTCPVAGKWNRSLTDPWWMSWIPIFSNLLKRENSHCHAMNTTSLFYSSPMNFPRCPICQATKINTHPLISEKYGWDISETSCKVECHGLLPTSLHVPITKQILQHSVLEMKFQTVAVCAVHFYDLWNYFMAATHFLSHSMHEGSQYLGWNLKRDRSALRSSHVWGKGWLKAHKYSREFVDGVVEVTGVKFNWEMSKSSQSSASCAIPTLLK